MRFLLPFLFLIFAQAAFAQGGPPMITDDPGTPGGGNWEINTAAQWTVGRGAANLQLPLFDINYGYGDHLQFNVNTSLVTVFGSGITTKSGESPASLAVKWRFLDEDRTGVDVSIYPRIDFHDHFISSDNPNISEPGTRTFLPIEIEKHFGRLSLNPEVGYATYTESTAEWSYGFVAGWEFHEGSEAMVEFHGRHLVGSGEREVFFNLGTRQALAEGYSLLVAIGRSVQGYSDEPLSWTTYLGLQTTF